MGVRSRPKKLPVKPDYNVDDRPHANTGAVRLAQNEFWRTLDRMIPKVLSELKRVLPFSQAFHQGQHHIDFSGHVAAWADRWNLNAGWCCVDALTFLEGWASGQLILDNILPATFLSATLTDAERLFFFSDEGWHSSTEPWGAAQKRMIGRFRQELRRYRSRMQLSSKGMPRSILTKTEPAHFEWLIQYHFKRQSFDEIAKDVKWISGEDGRKTVEQAVKRTAELIRFPLRTGSKGGRPQGSTSSPRRR